MSTQRQHAIAADCVFDGTSVLRNAAIVAEGSEIVALVPHADLPAAMPVATLPADCWLAPGFIDLQVNGGGDVLFNDVPSPDGIRAIAAAHRRFGTTGLLPTLITDAPETTKAALAAVQHVIDSEPGVLGIHLEGPFLSPERPGVHALRHIRVPTPEDAILLTAPRRGVVHVTLAPERVPPDFVRQLTGAGVRVSLGHSMATYAQTCAAMQEGLTGFTHLFNAMRPLGSREPGPIAAALESPGAWFGMIADGVHVDPAMLRLALRGAAKPILVTDAMPPVGGARSAFRLYGEDIVARDGKCVRGDGTLAGSMLDMATAVRNCVRLLDVPLESALRFASAHPASFLGLGHRLGRLAPGYRADMVAIEPKEVKVLRTWTAGREAERAS
ncbi:MAG TPA: N-acetylglucosamine-6-phosphate deacetylase [Xanthobacteraceae bacterium]|jgi:N-acetylglucosamine-6-phosphate deacetylase|nr:N-acetylglucosamine-6-phosphate deacetylase [Xanthobacteraceae bacterium]